VRRTRVRKDESYSSSSSLSSLGSATSSSSCFLFLVDMFVSGVLYVLSISYPLPSSECQSSCREVVARSEEMGEEALERCGVDRCLMGEGNGKRERRAKVRERELQS
jgi:hypothetical protein